MKRITVNAFEKGLVSKNGNLVKILSEGNHWIWPTEEAMVLNTMVAILVDNQVKGWLKNEAFSSMVEVVEVKHHEIALQFEEGNFCNLLSSGKYVFWKETQQYQFQLIDLNQVHIPANLDALLLARKELLPYIRTFVVAPYEQAVLFVDGEFERVLAPGNYTFWKNPRMIHVNCADARLVQLEVSGQEILTKDKAGIRVNFYTQYQVTDIMKALVQTKEFEKQLYVLIQLSLRAYMSTFTLDELLEKKEEIQAYVLSTIQEKAAALGLTVVGCGIKDIILPGDIKDIMNQVLVAEKRAQANVIMRREETASTRSLLNTAKLMEENAMLFKLKEMEYVEKIAEKIEHLSLASGANIGEQLHQLFVHKK
jgi:regulator of protease activity HflC (stomatin/prohibitin superfamily)